LSVDFNSEGGGDLDLKRLPKTQLVTRHSSLVTAVNRPGYDEALAAARYIAARSGMRPRLGVILGSGLGDAVARLEKARRLPYSSIANFPRSTVVGHAGELRLGLWQGVPAAVLCGRMHLYEGYTAAEAALPTRALALAGIEFLFVSCAAGGIAARARPGSPWCLPIT
jgi:purine-nucleoside phosphorylase